MVNIAILLLTYDIVVSRRCGVDNSSTIPERLEVRQIEKWWLAVNPDKEVRLKHHCCVCHEVLGMTEDHFLATVKNDIFVPGGRGLGPSKLAVMAIFKSDESHTKNYETNQNLVWIAWGTRPSWSPMDQINGLCVVPHKVLRAVQLYAARMRYAARLQCEPMVANTACLSSGNASAAADVTDDDGDAVAADDADETADYADDTPGEAVDIDHDANDDGVAATTASTTPLPPDRLVADDAETAFSANIEAATAASPTPRFQRATDDADDNAYDAAPGRLRALADGAT